VFDFESKNFLTANTYRYLILGVILVSAVFLAFYGSGKSLWADEAYSVFIARLDFSDALRELSVDTHPPFYYFLLTLWVKLFGHEEHALRLLSTIFYFASIFLVYCLAKELYDRETGYLASFLYLLSPLATWSAHSVRMYSLLGFLCVSSTYFFIKIFLGESQSKIVFWGCIFINACGILTHVWFFFFCFSQALIYLSLFFPKQFSRALKISVLSFLPFTVLWGSIFLGQLGNAAVDWIDPPSIKDLFVIFLGYFGEKIAYIAYSLMSVLLFSSSSFRRAFKQYAGAGFFTKLFGDKRRMMFLTIMFGTLVVPFIISQVKPIFGGTRFNIVSLHAFILLVAPLLCKYVNRTVLIIGCTLLLAICGTALVKYYNRDAICSEKLFVKSLIAHSRTGDAIIFTGASRTVMEYYLEKFGAEKNYRTFTFPKENDFHRGYFSVSKPLDKRAELDLEAENLVQTINQNLPPTNKIWFTDGNAAQINEILKRKLENDFQKIGQIDDVCRGVFSPDFDVSYTGILEYGKP